MVEKIMTSSMCLFVLEENPPAALTVQLCDPSLSFSLPLICRSTWSRRGRCTWSSICRGPPLKVKHHNNTLPCVLGAGKMGELKGLRVWQQGPHCDGWTTGSEHLLLCSSCGVFPLCSGQYLSKVVQGRDSGEPVTGSWAAKGSEGRPGWSDPTDELLKKFMLVLIERCQNTQGSAVWCIWGSGSTNTLGPLGGQNVRTDQCLNTLVLIQWLLLCHTAWAFKIIHYLHCLSLTGLECWSLSQLVLCLRLTLYPKEINAYLLYFVSW